MLPAAFILGLTGSLHCVGMCGVLAFQAGKTTGTTLLYHAGRITTYILLGLVAGWISRFMAFTGWLGWFSVILGLVVILLLIFHSSAKWLSLRFNRALFQLQQRIGFLLKKKSGYAAMGVGLFNGLLPCGLVYSAVVLALVQPDIIHSILVMLLFGLGTVPALMALKWLTGRMLEILPVSFQKVQTTMLALTGILLIWRGASMINLFSISDTVLCYPLP